MGKYLPLSAPFYPIPFNPLFSDFFCIEMAPYKSTNRTFSQRGTLFCYSLGSCTVLNIEMYSVIYANDYEGTHLLL